MTLLLLGWLAWAAPEGGEAASCGVSLPTPPERLAVAWVGRWGREPRGQIRVVAAADLAGWVAAQHPAWTGRTLQKLGLRKRGTDPKRRWKVVVFEVDRSLLCRPMIGGEATHGGVAVCPSRRSEASRRQDGCGSTLDHKTGEPGFAAYFVPVRAATQNGTCEIPLTRYVEEAGKRPSPKTRR